MSDRLCYNKNCGELHGYSWTNPEKPAIHRTVTPPEIWCSYTCAAYDKAYSVTKGWDEKVLSQVKKELS